MTAKLQERYIFKDDAAHFTGWRTYLKKKAVRLFIYRRSFHKLAVH
jgi:hypothetical protein